MSYDPIDSLIYLHKGLGLDAVAEEIGERFGYTDENEDSAFIVEWIESIEQRIKTEMVKHYDGRRRYSTGVPFSRRYEFPTHGPNEDGVEELYWAEVHVMMHPDGTPKEPSEKRGRWIDDGGAA